MLVVVGEAIVVFQRDHVPDGARPLPPRPPDPSGAPAISAYVAARLGVETTFVGGVGRDELGTMFRRRLLDAGVAGDALRVAEGLPTATATVQYFADGSRRFEFSVAGTAATDVSVDQLGSLPERARWLHVSGSALLFGEPLAGTVVTAVRRAHAAGVTTSLDPNVRTEAMTPAAAARLAELCGVVDLLLPSDGELAALGVDEGPLLRRGTTICTTSGPDGCRVATAAGEVSLPVHRGPDVVDTDGAGDTFAAAFIAATLRGADPVAAARVAGRVAAAAIAVRGPMSVELGPADAVTEDD